MSYMRDEMGEQPDVVRRTAQEERPSLARVAEAIKRHNPSLILIAARGTSDNAATYAKYLWGLYTGLPVALAAPALTTLYEAPLSLRHAVVVGISQSGESTDIVEVVRAARTVGALTVAVTSNAESTLANVAAELAFCPSGPERSVAATKTYTAQLAVLGHLAASYSGDQELLAALERVPDAMQRVLKAEPELTALAQRYATLQSCAVVARGLNYCTALETALKLKETCYVLADPYSAADLRHGPIAIVEPGFPALLFAAPGRAYASMHELSETLRAKGAETLVFSSEREALDAATAPITLPPPVAPGLAGEAVSPLIYAVAGQLFAHALCLAKGRDPDRPRGLQKVTLTL